MKWRLNVDRGGARLTLVEGQAILRIEDGPAVLNDKGPRIPIEKVHAGYAMKKAAKHAR